VAEQVYEGHRLILVRPDLHVVWRGRDGLPEPGRLATLASGHLSNQVVLGRS
jgi:hypothetical protein